jgi:hypothetical protein
MADSRRRAEIEAKRQKLAELRIARERRQKAEQERRQSEVSMASPHPASFMLTGNNYLDLISKRRALPAPAEMSTTL